MERANAVCSIRRVGVFLLLAFFVSHRAGAQDISPNADSQSSPEINQQLNSAKAYTGPRATLHGMVKNSATGEPLPRALIRLEGDAASGALTDGDGHFEIAGVPVGQQVVSVTKPGFRDQVVSGAGASVTVINGSTNVAPEHNVRVAPDMPDLVFAMAPTNSIRGQIDLSTGDPAQGIGVMLLRRAVQDGRAVWQTATNTRTNSEGSFRFANLEDGVYAIYTEPSMDSELPATLVEAGSGRAGTRAGFASMFYPEARDLAGAGKIQLSGGQSAQANLLLTEEAFRLVKALVTTAGQDLLNGADATKMNMGITVLDAQGHQLPYSGQFDWPSHTVQAYLPDGTYSLLLTAMRNLQGRLGVRSADGNFDRLDVISKSDSGPTQLTGQVEFSVAGRSVTNLRLPLSAQARNTVQVSLFRTNAQQTAGRNTQGGPIVIMASQAGGWISDGMVSSFGEGYPSGPIETTPMNPGAYWIHTSIPQKGLCESSFTAGGSSLGREPLVLSLSGASAPLTLTLRDDCATLKLSLPPALERDAGGDEPYYTVWIVPDFDSTADVTPITLRPSSGGTITVDGLTPGAYRVYTFAGPVDLEYRNSEAMAALPSPGQAVTLAPSDTANLVVEVQGH